MKKTIISLLSLTVITLLFVTSCLQVTTSDLLTQPTVETQGATISISIPRQSADTKYINLYRKDLTDNEEINVGIVYPKANESNGSAYIYIDNLIYKNHKYSYMARYKEDDEYLSTEWSNEVTASDGYDSSKLLKFNTSTINFNYDDVTNKLVVSAAPTEPGISNFSTDYQTMLVIKSENATQAFEIGNLAPANPIYLRSLLPKEFLGIDITIVGIIGQKKEYVAGEENKPEDQRTVKRLIWTAPASIPIIGYTNTSLNIPISEAKEGFDYSRKITD